MKITFVMPRVSQNGGSRVVATYAAKLKERGHEVVVVSRSPNDPSWARRLLTTVRGRRLHGVDWPGRTLFFDGLGERHVQIGRTGPLRPEDLPDADVVVATWWRTAFEVATMPPEKGRQAYFVQHYEVHDHLPWDLSSGSYWLPLEKITIAPWLARILAERYDAPNVPVIPNSIDTDAFDAPPRSRNRVPRVGFLYVPTPMKGTDLALRAIDALRQARPDLEVVTFGFPPPDPAFPIPAGTTYHRTPPQPEIPALYASADVWMMASRSEGFGLPLLEAMACRTPVVASRTGGAESFIDDGVEGRLVPTGDAEALAAAVDDVLSLDPDAWRRMSDAAHARVRSWTWDDAVAAMETELARIAALPPRQATGPEPR